MKNRWIMPFIALFPAFLMGQNASHLKKKAIWPVTDTLMIDSLSIIPGTLLLQYKAKEIDQARYSADYVNGIVVFRPDAGFISDTLKISYQTFPVRLNKTYRYLKPGQNRISPVRYNSLLDKSQRNSNSNNSASGGNLFTSGDLSRGIQLGNNQDASLNSNLNLKITGRINDQFSIEAQLSDANIPVQPEGNTAQLQEFDRLYIRLYSARTHIQAGDFVLNSPKGYFQHMNKNLQGIQFKTGVKTGLEEQGNFETRSTAAIVKGKFNRMKFNGTEGNQGAYRLTGTEGEQYIQVIAASEKVYIDGLLLTRGENEDYTINYNTAELSFTPKRIITKDKRITVEFEYTDRSYARFVVSTENEWETNRGGLYFNIYHESDARNQPLLQDLTDNQKSLLAGIGDHLNQAYVNNYYTSGFSNDRVLYRKTDSLLNGVLYEDILVYNTQPDSAIYQAGFSFVGQNNGNYLPVQSSANGQVYQWIAPIDGVKQGSYEPITRLVTPKKKQLYSFGGHTRIGNRMAVKGELSFSSNDLNTFSDLDSDDNTGTGIMTELTRLDKLKADSSLLLASYIRYRRVGKQYDALEPFRAVEFERDWNLQNNQADATENLLESGLRLQGRDSIRATYDFSYLAYNQAYQANRHTSTGQVRLKKNEINWTGSLMQSADNFRTTRFMRHQLDLIHHFNTFSLSLSENHESNSWTLPEMDELEDGSFKFQEVYARVSAAESKKTKWFLEVKQRNDFLPDSSGFIRSYQSLENTAGMSFFGKKGQLTRLSWNYRKLDPIGDSLPDQPENTMTLRAEEQFSILRGFIKSGTFYEIGSGLERKQEFYYLEVPAGQGYYTWSDYNGNNIKELDEFEPAVFSDQAAYIRVYRPGTGYLPVFTNRFTQTLSLQPAALLQNNQSGWSFLKRFSNQFSFNVNRRNQRTDLIAVMNPFILTDSLIVSMQSQLRNNLSFNTASRKFGMDYVISQSQNQTLMNYGTDRRQNQSHSIVFRWRPFDPLWLNNQAEMGMNDFSSEFFTNRNYQIDFQRNTLRITLELTDQSRMNLEWIAGREIDRSGRASNFQQQVELGADYQIPGKGVIHLDLNYIHYDFTGEANSPVGYVMLKGFRPGHNGMANLNFRRKISEVIQLDLNYGLRISEAERWIHTGNIAVRAVF